MPSGLTQLAIAPVTTTDATPTQILLLPIPDDSAAHAEIRIVAYCVATGEGAFFSGMLAGKRVGTGALQQIGATIANTPQRDTGAASWTVSIGASGDQPAITVTGQAAKTIKWSVFGTMGITR